MDTHSLLNERMRSAGEPEWELSDMTGSFGPWQSVVFAVFFYINVVGIWQNLSITFLAPNVDFRCVAPPSDSNATCWVEVAGNRTPCTAWEYDTSVYSETIVSEWDLVCTQEWLVSLAKSVYMIGFLLSVLFFGQFSDWMGRYPTVVISYFITLISQLLSLLSSSYIMFVILRFFQALGRTGLTTVGFVLLMEMVGPQHRTEVGIGIQLGWSLGFVSLAVLAYFIRHWFWLQVAMTLPLLPLILTFKIIPESPRWLLVKGKTEKLKKLLNAAAKMNKKDSKCQISSLEVLQNHIKEEKGKAGSVLDLFKGSKMRNKILIMIYLWMVNSFMYYGFSFNTNELAGDPYLNFFLAGVLEFPSYALLFLLVRRFGRRPALVSLMLIGGSACALALIPMPDGARTGLAQSGKFCVTASFGLLYLYTGELFPTSVRSVALGTCSCTARIGSILAPFARELGQISFSWVPDALYAFLAVSSGLLALLLPETRDKRLDDTIREDPTTEDSKTTSKSDVSADRKSTS